EGPKKRRQGKESTRTDGGGPAKNVTLTELDSKGWGKVTGKVKYDGAPPAMPEIAAIKTHADKNLCQAGADFEKREQTWIVGGDGGVANVVVWVSPPDGKFFKIKDDLKKPANVQLRQPHCAFIAHVVVGFPQYQEKTDLPPRKTGQKLEV